MITCEILKKYLPIKENLNIYLVIFSNFFLTFNMMTQWNNCLSELN